MVAQGHGNNSRKLTPEAVWCGLPHPRHPSPRRHSSPALVCPTSQPLCHRELPTCIFPQVPDLAGLPQLTDVRGMLTGTEVAISLACTSKGENMGLSAAP